MISVDSLVERATMQIVQPEDCEKQQPFSAQDATNALIKTSLFTFDDNNARITFKEDGSARCVIAEKTSSLSAQKVKELIEKTLLAKKSQKEEDSPAYQATRKSLSSSLKKVLHRDVREALLNLLAPKTLISFSIAEPSDQSDTAPFTLEYSDETIVTISKVTSPKGYPPAEGKHIRLSKKVQGHIDYKHKKVTFESGSIHTYISLGLFDASLSVLGYKCLHKDDGYLVSVTVGNFFFTKDITSPKERFLASLEHLETTTS